MKNPTSHAHTPAKWRHVHMLLAAGIAFASCGALALEPRLILDAVPSLGASGTLSGHVENTHPANHHVAVYIYVEGSGGWWNKPSFDEAATPIAPGGTWSVNIDTGGADRWATKIAAFLLDATTAPPILEGAQTLPDVLLENARTHAALYRSALGNTRLLYFSGHEWWVKNSSGPVGPGPNYFSDSQDNVWMDSEHRLHLKISKVTTQYRCAEVVSTQSFGHGAYVFHLDSPVAQIDPMAVLGLFTWSDAPEYTHREIDIEYSRWGDSNNEAGQFVIQPWDEEGNIDRFPLEPQSAPTTSAFIWGPESVKFFSVLGSAINLPNPNETIHSWTYTGFDLPEPGGENARMNLWLMSGQAPTDGQEIEVIVRAFDFVPLAELNDSSPGVPIGKKALALVTGALMAASLYYLGKKNAMSRLARNQVPGQLP